MLCLLSMSTWSIVYFCAKPSVRGSHSLRALLSGRVSRLHCDEAVATNTINTDKNAKRSIFIFLSLILQTLDLQRSSLHQGLYDKCSKFMPIKKV